jgi:hypothetical protein
MSDDGKIELKLSRAERSALQTLANKAGLTLDEYIELMAIREMSISAPRDVFAEALADASTKVAERLLAPSYVSVRIKTDDGGPLDVEHMKAALDVIPERVADLSMETLNARLRACKRPAQAFLKSDA